MIGTAVGDPINRVNLLYFIDIDRIHRIDPTRDIGSINPDPVYIDKVEQIHAVDGIADGDSNQPRSALAPWLAGLIVLVVAQVWASAWAPAWAVECWRGWGYRVDPGTRTYKSEELLLVTKGPTTWRTGVPVELHRLDRASGAIDAAAAPLTVVPAGARTYYRGRANYVDGRGAIVGSGDELVFGLSHVAPPVAALETLEDYHRWACGLGKTR